MELRKSSALIIQLSSQPYKPNTTKAPNWRLPYMYLLFAAFIIRVGDESHNIFVNSDRKTENTNSDRKKEETKTCWKIIVCRSHKGLVHKAEYGAS